MLQNVFLGAIVLGATALLVVASDLQCPVATGNMNPYSPSELPSNCTAVTNCTQALCDCTMQTYDPQDVTCTGSVESIGCDLAKLCFGTFTQCLLTNGIQDDCGAWSAFLKDAYVEYLVADQLNYNNTAIFSSCANAACHYLNSTFPTCLPDWAPTDTCFQAPSNGSNLLTPQPLPPGVANGGVEVGPDGKYHVNVTIIQARLKFNGDFTAIFKDGNNSATANSMANTVVTTVEAQIQFTIHLIQMFQGSLVVDFFIAVLASQPDVAASLATNIGLLTSGGGGNKWYAALQAACQSVPGGCPGGITGVVAAITQVYGLTGVPSPNSGPTQATCETRCIAFIVIGIVVTVTVVIAALLIYKHRVDSERQIADVKTPSHGHGEGQAVGNPLA